MKPISDRVVIKEIVLRKISGSSLFMPDEIKKDVPVARGVIVEVGEGKTTEKGTKLPMSLNVGDEVFYLKQAGVEIKIDNQVLTVVSEAHVLVVLDESQKTKEEDMMTEEDKRFIFDADKAIQHGLRS